MNFDAYSNARVLDASAPHARFAVGERPSRSTLDVSVVSFRQQAEAERTLQPTKLAWL